MKKFNNRIVDLEVRSCDKFLMLKGKHVTAEIVKWYQKNSEKEYCFTIAYWENNAEGFYLKFVGDRPFDFEIDSETFMILAKIGQESLDKNNNK